MRLHQFPSKHVPRTSIIGFSIGHPHRTMTDGVPVIATLNYEHVPSAAHFDVPMLQRRPLAFCPKRQPCRVRKRGCSGGGGIMKSMHFWQTNSSLRNVSCSLCARQCNPPTRSFMPNTEIINLAFAFTFAFTFHFAFAPSAHPSSVSKSSNCCADQLGPLIAKRRDHVLIFGLAYPRKSISINWAATMYLAPAFPCLRPHPKKPRYGQSLIF